MTEQVQDPSVDALIGKVVDARYRILERIGQGGMGVVYRVEHTRIGKIAAMKVLHPALVSDAEVMRRFKGEAEAISRLNHPNIVQVFDFGSVAGTAYLVMEFLRGEDLAAILKRDGRLDLRRCTAVTLQLCDALTEAHELGIIHRDLKPENVRVSRTKDGKDFVKVLDFGLAKMIGREAADVTAQGTVVGTPYYMSPEQIRCQALDARADIYSVGAMLYRMLTGQNAYRAKTPVGVLTKHLTETPVSPSDSAPGINIPRGVDAVVMRAMAKQRENRYASAQHLKQALIELAREQRQALQQSGEVPTLTRRESDSGGLDEPSAARSGDTSQPVDLDHDPNLAFLPTGQMALVDIPTDADVRLARDDIAFEHRLHRWRLIKPLLALVPLLLGGAFAAYWYGFRQPVVIAPPVEIESNDAPDGATRIEAGKPIAGHIGRRLSDEESDRDWYRLDVYGDGLRLLAATVSKIPNMDLTLELFDGMGGRITHSDSTGVGGAETIPNWPVGAGRYYLVVREHWSEGDRPTENVTDAYELLAKLGPLPDGWEREPNDLPEHATALALGKPMRGILGRVGDRDHFRLELKPGEVLSGELDAVPTVDLVLEVHGVGPEPLVVDDQTVSGGERFNDLRATASGGAIFVVRRKLERKPEGGRSPGGLDRPYRLRVWSTGATAH